MFPTESLGLHINSYFFQAISVAACLRRGSAAAHLLVLRVRIPPIAYKSVVSAVCCHVEVSTSGCSLVQKSPTECGVSECDHEATIMRRPWPTRDCYAPKKIFP